MVATPVSICNLALGARLGQVRISALSDSTEEARWSNEFYAIARDFVTADALWGHARCVASLTELSDNDLEDDYTYAYQRPSDCLRVVYLLPEMGRFDQRSVMRTKRIGSTIYSDEPNARLYYIKQVTETSTYSPAFVQALAWYLAHLLANPLLKSPQLMADMLNGYAVAKANAIATDEAEEILAFDADEQMPDWLAARG